MARCVSVSQAGRRLVPYPDRKSVLTNAKATPRFLLLRASRTPSLSSPQTTLPLITTMHARYTKEKGLGNPTLRQRR